MSENKKKYAYWMKPSMVEEMTEMLDTANATSKSDFVCQAVQFYTVTAFAAEESGGNALTAINNLSTFIFGLIRAVGLILTGFGVVQIGLSLKSHDPSQRANGFLTLAGGVIITFAKEILNLIIGS